MTVLYCITMCVFCLIFNAFCHTFLNLINVVGVVGVQCTEIPKKIKIEVTSIKKIKQYNSNNSIP